MFPLTIFTACKPFKKEPNITNQRNAVASWRRLTDDVLLIGKERGVKETASEFSCRYFPDVERNRWRTPYISSIFRVAEDNAKYGLLCYLDADVILLKDFTAAADVVVKKFDKFLAVGRRWELRKVALMFETSEQILDFARKSGAHKKKTAGTDCFLYPKGLYGKIPPLVTGTRRWDLWMIGDVLRRGIPVVDITHDVMIIHQKHPEWPRAPEEVRRNVRIVGPDCPKGNVADATWVLKGGKICLRTHGNASKR